MVTSENTSLMIGEFTGPHDQAIVSGFIYLATYFSGTRPSSSNCSII